MSEQVFSVTVNNEMIYGIWSRPEAVSSVSGSAAVILLHGWGGYRTGPHDMLVKLAVACPETDTTVSVLTFAAKATVRATAGRPATARCRKTWKRSFGMCRRS